jgi:hypothetical protein
MEKLHGAERDEHARSEEGNSIDVWNIAHAEGYGRDHDGFGDAVPRDQPRDEPPRFP